MNALRAPFPAPYRGHHPQSSSSGKHPCPILLEQSDSLPLREGLEDQSNKRSEQSVRGQGAVLGRKWAWELGWSEPHGISRKLSAPLGGGCALSLPWPTPAHSSQQLFQLSCCSGLQVHPHHS